jgi:hypothetical protein
VAGLVKHLSLHRIGDTELRVVSDIDSGVVSLIEIEERVIRAYRARASWPHRWVTLFVLEDLGPLLRSLSAQHRKALQLPADTGDSGGRASIGGRPVVNVYDLADLSQCHVFVNRQAMVLDGYWDDTQAIEALLAHEHSHPLSECATTASARDLTLKLSLSESGASSAWTVERAQRVHRLLADLGQLLCFSAPREVLTNDHTIGSGFAVPMSYLNRSNVRNACRGMDGRERVYAQMHDDVARGALNSIAAQRLQLIGDLWSALPLAMEIVPFLRSGRASVAQDLEGVLEACVLSRTNPAVREAWEALCAQYRRLTSSMGIEELRSWSENTLHGLGTALLPTDLILRWEVRCDGVTHHAT